MAVRARWDAFWGDGQQALRPCELHGTNQILEVGSFESFYRELSVEPPEAYFRSVKNILGTVFLLLKDSQKMFVMGFVRGIESSYIYATNCGTYIYVDVWELSTKQSFVGEDMSCTGACRRGIRLGALNGTNSCWEWIPCTEDWCLPCSSSGPGAVRSETRRLTR